MNDVPDQQPQRIAVIGGAVLDRKYHARRELVMETSNPIDGHRSFGGVARNVAENLVRLNIAVSFVSIVGDDEAGRSLREHLRRLGADVSQVIVTPERPTAEYAAVLDPRNDLVLGLADMRIFDLLQPALLDSAWPHIAAADWIFADCNLPEQTLATLIRRRQRAGFRLAVNAVSTPKALRLPKDLAGIDLLFANLDEANAILGRKQDSRLAAPDAAASLRAAGADEVIVTHGSGGYAIATAAGVTMAEAVPADPVDITGAGDAMVAGTLYRMLAGEPLARSARTGALLASLTTESEMSVHPDLSPRLLEAAAHRIPA